MFLLDSRTTTGQGLELTGSLEFSGNAAIRSGGAIYIENGDLTVVPDAGAAEASWVGNSAG